MSDSLKPLQGIDPDLLRASGLSSADSVFQVSLDLLCIAGLDGWFKKVSRSFESALAYPLEELMARPFIEIVAPEDRERTYGEVLRLAEGKQTLRFEIQILRKEGTRRWYQWTAVPIPGEPHFVALGRDVTEHRLMQQALQESEERFRTLADQAPVGIFMTDMAGIPLYLNRAWCMLAGRTLEQTRRDGWDDILHPEDRERVFQEWEESVRDGREFSSEYRYITPDGKIRWIYGRACRVRDSQGAQIGYLGTNTDISERKHSERLKNDFISTKNHELRTPLTSLLGSIGLVLGDAVGPIDPKVRTMLEIAQRNGDRLLLMINDLLDLQKIESGRMGLRLAPLDPGGVMERAAEANRVYASRLGVQLETQPPDDGRRCIGDPERILQVLTNLISNAAKFSPPGKPVRLGIEPNGAFVRFTVADEGPGIPEDFKPRVFDKFAQADMSDSRGVAGTGLGLSICKAFVEQMKGDIGFEDALPRGTRFYVDLPAAG